MRKGSSNTILVVVVVIIIMIVAFILVSKKNTTVAPEKMPPTETPAQKGSTMNNSGTNSGIVAGDNQGSPMTSSLMHIQIKGFAYTPSKVTVKRGTMVTWKNNDSTVHTVTANDKSFDSGDLPNGKAFNHTFNTVGTFDYTCTYHPNMKGSVIVE